MKLVVSQKSEKPIYEQLYEQIAAGILSGVLPSDFCLPSIRKIACELGISVITVKNAYERLENEGYIYTRAGKGCFVGAHPKETLDKRRYDYAESSLAAAVCYCKSLGLSEEETVELVRGIYCRSEKKEP